MIRMLFDSVRFGSEKYVSRFDAVRLAFFGGVVARSGPVRFRAVPAGSRIKRFGSVRPLRFGFSSLPLNIGRTCNIQRWLPNIGRRL